MTDPIWRGSAGDLAESYDGPAELNLTTPDVEVVVLRAEDYEQLCGEPMNEQQMNTLMKLDAMKTFIAEMKARFLDVVIGLEEELDRLDEMLSDDDAMEAIQEAETDG